MPKKLSEETKKKISETMKKRRSERDWWLGRSHKTSSRKKTSRIIKRYWRDKSFARKVGLAQRRRPTRPELVFEEILNIHFPDEWKYVGDGSLYLGKNLNPDFISTSSNKVIELFGDYWHRGHDPEDRIKRYKDIGYDCLVVWTKELEGIPFLVKKILDWMGRDGN